MGKDNLDTTRPINILLGKKYNIPPFAVAYIRAAIMQGKFTRETLIDNILKDNTFRLRTIKNLSRKSGLRDDQKVQIHSLEKKINSRKIALFVLENLKEEELTDLLQPEEK